MASATVHYQQATHNKALAEFLFAQNPATYYDWAITAAFYSSIHWVESYFYFVPGVVHTESSIPTNPENGELRYSPHAWRARLVQNNCEAEVWKGFRVLHEASQAVRYLSNRERISHDKPAVSIYTLADAKKMVDVNLSKILLSDKFKIIRAVLEGSCRGEALAEDSMRQIISGFVNYAQFLTNPKFIEGRLAAPEYEKFYRNNVLLGLWKKC